VTFKVIQDCGTIKYVTWLPISGPL